MIRSLVVFGIVAAVPLVLLTAGRPKPRVLRAAQAQSAPSNGTNASLTMPLGSVDGSKTPELIPDSVAYRLFFVAVSEPGQTTPERASRQASHLAKTGLNEADREALAEELATFNAQYSDVRSRYQQAEANAKVPGLTVATVDPTTFIAERDAIVADTQARLSSRLSPEGISLLQAHIQREKRTMKLIASPPMSAH